MRKPAGIVLSFTAVLMAGSVWAQGESRPAQGDRAERAAPSALERGLERLERAVARLEARLAGRGGSMDGCADMMAGGGMMERSRPNERWRFPAR